MLCKVSVGPASMIAPAATSFSTQAFAEQTSQPHPDPPVQIAERGAIAMFEVFKPASQPWRQVVDDLRQALSRGPFRLCSDRVLELLEALRPRESASPLEPVAQKVEDVFRRIDDLGFLRMQFQV